MSEASYASLGPTLLARKGGAKPAMRPQLAPLPANSAEIAALADEQLEDLGWNDMGGDTDEAESDWFDPDSSENDLIIDPLRGPVSGGEVVSITSRTAMPAPANEDTLAADASNVKRLQKRLALELPSQSSDLATGDWAQIGDMEQVDKSAPLLRKKDAAQFADDSTLHAKARPAAKDSAGRRAAFTLRLDADRHMKLRLASTMQGVSAQALVTQALDQLLEEFHDLDAIVARMRRD